MRVEPSKRSGYFWLPTTPEHQLPGTLTVSAGGKVELEVLGHFGGPNALLLEEPDVSRIVGRAEGWGAVTLDRCFVTGQSAAMGGVSKTTVFVHLLIAGLIFDADEALLFERLEFSVDGLHEWLCVTGFEISHNLDTPRSQYVYQRPDNVSFELSDDIRGELGLSCTLPGRPLGGQVSIVEKAVFSIVPVKPEPLDTLTQLAQRIVHFYCFAADQTTCISAIRAQSPLAQLENRSESDTQGPYVQLICQSLPYTEQLPRHLDHRMLFRFPQIRDNLDAMFRRWISAYALVQPALDLYFSSRTGAYRYIEGRFLSLAQAVETLHRRTSDETVLSPTAFTDRVRRVLDACPPEDQNWLAKKLSFANELSLRVRLERLTDPFSSRFGGRKRVKSFVSHVVAWRNYLTHYDAQSEKALSDPRELFPLCMKLEALLQLHWLQTIDFSESMIDSVVAQSPALQNKLRGQPGYGG